MPTPIEWCDETFNPWWGCERVSPACAHCYADDTARFRKPGLKLWGAGHEFRFFGDNHWQEPLKWARTLPAKLGRRPRVFCASMADVFEDRPELEPHRERLFDLIDQTPELDWLILTKRPEFAAVQMRVEWLLPTNVWMGVSIENARYTFRADVLRRIPAAVRFISAEPLLGSLFEHPRASLRVPIVDGELQLNGEDLQRALRATPDKRAPLDLTGIDWVIIGGESGPKARTPHLDWFHELVQASEAAGAAVFVKQLGSKLGPVYGAGRKGGALDHFPDGLRVRDFPRSAVPA